MLSHGATQWGAASGFTRVGSRVAKDSRRCQAPAAVLSRNAEVSHATNTTPYLINRTLVLHILERVSDTKIYIGFIEWEEPKT